MQRLTDAEASRRRQKLLAGHELIDTDRPRQRQYGTRRDAQAEAAMAALDFAEDAVVYEDTSGPKSIYSPARVSQFGSIPKRGKGNPKPTQLPEVTKVRRGPFRWSTPGKTGWFSVPR